MGWNDWIIIGMFKQFFHLELAQPHDKSGYSLKKNEVIWHKSKEERMGLKFDHILYEEKDVLEKICYEIVLQAHQRPNNSVTCLNIIFNYKIQHNQVHALINHILQVKMFTSFQSKLARFQVKNAHVADYHRKHSFHHSPTSDQLDQFEREIDSSLKLDRIQKIGELITYVPINSNSSQQLLLSSFKNAKHSNEFLILWIGESICINLIIFPRCKEYVLNKEEDREIEQLLVMKKHGKDEKIHLKTPLAQITKHLLKDGQTNILLSKYPSQSKSLEEVLAIHFKLSTTSTTSLSSIVDFRNKNVSSFLKHELQNVQIKLKELQITQKRESQNINKLMKIYTKSFHHYAGHLDFLKNKNVTNVNLYKNYIKKQIELKSLAVKEEQDILKEIHLNFINSQEKHKFYLDKVMNFKNNLLETIRDGSLSSKYSQARTPNKDNSENHTQEANELINLTDEQVLFFYFPEKQMQKHKQKMRLELTNRIRECKERKQLENLSNELKQKIPKSDYNQLEMKYELLSDL